jgi:hypothetical protein
MTCDMNEDRRAENGAGQAAHAIVQLINSRPQSPRYEEIVAIIERLAVSPMRQRNADVLGLDEYGPDLTLIASSKTSAGRWP